MATVVNYSKVNAMLIQITNLDSQRRFTAGTIDAKRASTGAIQEAILVADSQVVMADIDNPYHYRNLTAQADLNHADSVPGGVMRPCTVLIKIASSDSVYVPAVRPLGVDADQIERWRRNHNNVYGPYAHNDPNSPLGAKYAFKGNIIVFTGTVARIMRAPEFVIDRATPACQAQEIYTMLVLSGGVFLLYQEGLVSDALYKEHAGIWQSGIKALQQRALMLLGTTLE